jgi:hypothetical protein
MCLQFTEILAASCVLHRYTSRVIHRLEQRWLISMKQIAKDQTGARMLRIFRPHVVHQLRLTHTADATNR